MSLEMDFGFDGLVDVAPVEEDQPSTGLISMADLGSGAGPRGPGGSDAFRGSNSNSNSHSHSPTQKNNTRLQIPNQSVAGSSNVTTNSSVMTAPPHDGVGEGPWDVSITPDLESSISICRSRVNDMDSDSDSERGGLAPYVPPTSGRQTTQPPPREEQHQQQQQQQPTSKNTSVSFEIPVGDAPTGHSTGASYSNTHKGKVNTVNVEGKQNYESRVHQLLREAHHEITAGGAIATSVENSNNGSGMTPQVLGEVFRASGSRELGVSGSGGGGGAALARKASRKNSVVTTGHNKGFPTPAVCLRYLVAETYTDINISVLVEIFGHLVGLIASGHAVPQPARSTGGATTPSPNNKIGQARPSRNPLQKNTGGQTLGDLTTPKPLPPAGPTLTRRASDLSRNTKKGNKPAAIDYQMCAFESIACAEIDRALERLTPELEGEYVDWRRFVNLWNKYKPNPLESTTERDLLVQGLVLFGFICSDCRDDPDADPTGFALCGIFKSARPDCELGSGSITSHGSGGVKAVDIRARDVPSPVNTSNSRNTVSILRKSSHGPDEKDRDKESSWGLLGNLLVLLATIVLTLCIIILYQSFLILAVSVPTMLCCVASTLLGYKGHRTASKLLSQASLALLAWIPLVLPVAAAGHTSSSSSSYSATGTPPGLAVEVLLGVLAVILTSFVGTIAQLRSEYSVNLCRMIHAGWTLSFWAAHIVCGVMLRDRQPDGWNRNPWSILTTVVTLILIPVCLFGLPLLASLTLAELQNRLVLAANKSNEFCGSTNEDGSSALSQPNLVLNTDGTLVIPPERALVRYSTLIVDAVCDGIPRLSEGVSFELLFEWCMGEDGVKLLAAGAMGGAKGENRFSSMTSANNSANNSDEAQRATPGMTPGNGGLESRLRSSHALSSGFSVNTESEWNVNFDDPYLHVEENKRAGSIASFLNAGGVAGKSKVGASVNVAGRLILAGRDLCPGGEMLLTTNFGMKIRSPLAATLLGGGAGGADASANERTPLGGVTGKKDPGIEGGVCDFMIVTTNEDGKVHTWGMDCRQVTNLRPEAILGRDFSELFPTAPSQTKVTSMIQSALHDEAVGSRASNLPFVMDRHGSANLGGVALVDLCAAPAKNFSGQTVGVTFTVKISSQMNTSVIEPMLEVLQSLRRDVEHGMFGNNSHAAEEQAAMASQSGGGAAVALVHNHADRGASGNGDSPAPSAQTLHMKQMLWERTTVLMGELAAVAKPPANPFSIQAAMATVMAHFPNDDIQMELDSRTSICIPNRLPPAANLHGQNNNNLNEDLQRLHEHPPQEMANLQQIGNLILSIEATTIMPWLLHVFTIAISASAIRSVIVSGTRRSVGANRYYVDILIKPEATDNDIEEGDFDVERLEHASVRKPESVRLSVNSRDNTVTVSVPLVTTERYGAVLDALDIAGTDVLSASPTLSSRDAVNLVGGRGSALTAGDSAADASGSISISTTVAPAGQGSSMVTGPKVADKHCCNFLMFDPDPVRQLSLRSVLWQRKHFAMAVDDLEELFQSPLDGVNALVVRCSTGDEYFQLMEYVEEGAASVFTAVMLTELAAQQVYIRTERDRLFEEVSGAQENTASEMSGVGTTRTPTGGSPATAGVVASSMTREQQLAMCQQQAEAQARSNLQHQYHSTGQYPLPEVAAETALVCHEEDFGLSTVHQAIDATVAHVSKIKAGEIKLGEIKALLAQTRSCPWEKGRLLGQGSFATVYEATNLTTGGKMACREVKITGDPASIPRIVEKILAEIKLMAMLEHPHIISYLYCERAEGAVNIFTELATQGSLRKYLDKHGAQSEESTARKMEQILKGLEYLHAENVVHLDLKADNILLTPTGCKLADFGTSKVLDHHQQEHTNKQQERSEVEDGGAYAEAADASRSSAQGGEGEGTMLFMAPEILASRRPTWQADIWSLGCVLMELSTGNHPFSHVSGSPLGVVGYVSDLADGRTPSTTLGDGVAVSVAAPNGNMVEVELPPYTRKCTESIHSFLAQCLQVDPSKRPSASELLRHPFITTTKEERMQATAKRAAVRGPTTRVVASAPEPSGGNNALTSNQLGILGVSPMYGGDDYSDDDESRRESCFSAWSAAARPTPVVAKMQFTVDHYEI